MEQNEKAKEKFSSFWQKTSDIGKKAAEGAKAFAEQTKKNIHEAQDKKYTAVTSDEFNSEDFKLPNIIEIVDDSANRNFITDDKAIGWIEKHEDVDVLHMYSFFAKESKLKFIPVPQRENVYCKDNFDSNKFINANQVFGKATEEKLAELKHIAYSLGAISCSFEIVEADRNSSSKAGKTTGGSEIGKTSEEKNMQSGKTIAHFQGNDKPKRPTLKWFAHDDNIKLLIKMRCADINSIKSERMELKGSSTEAVSRKIACAVDDILNIKGGFSLESQAIREYSNILIYEIEF